MTWNTKQESETVYFIEDSDTKAGSRILIGSIVKPPGDDLYHVEIMCFDGDIKGSFKEYTQALAFVEGVEKMQRLK